MIAIETLAPGLLKITPPEKLKAEDFAAAAPRVEEAARGQAALRLLVDATHFHGWENIQAFHAHMDFIKTHQRGVARIAVMAGAAWQHWVAGAVRLFVHPEIRVFDRGEESAARAWLEE